MSRGRCKLMGYRSYRPQTGEPATRTAGKPDWELYNIAEDPQEERNLIGDPGVAGIVKDLRADLDHKLAERRAAPKL